MQLELLEVIFRNFKSYGGVDTSVKLNRNTTCLIVGQNKDNTEQGVSSNGTGKTTILDAIVYALFDRPISDMTVNELINNINKKNMLVTLKFRLGSDEYEIERHRKTSDGTTVYLRRNGDDITLDSAARTNEEITNIIGMSFDVFIRLVAFSASAESFLQLTGPKQVAIGEELCRLTLLGEKGERLKDIQKGVKAEIVVQQRLLDSKKQEKDRHTAQLASAKQRVVNWEITHNNDIAVTTKKRDALRSNPLLTTTDFDEQDQMVVKHAALQGQINTLKVSLRSVETQRTQASRDKESTTREFQALSASKCPYCNQTHTDEQKLTKACDRIESLNAEAAVLTTTSADTTEEIATKLTELEQIATNMVTNLSQLKADKKALESIDKDLQTLEEASNPYLDALDEAVNQAVPDMEFGEINRLTTDLTHIELVVKLLTRKDSFIRQRLLSTTLPLLNQRLQQRLVELGLQHHVTFNPDLSTTISQFGREISFGSLSAGQRARVNIALALAFRDVRQVLHTPINLGFFDEILDTGLDGVGVRAAASLLKKIGSEEGVTIFVISHKEEIMSSFDDILNVVMEGGFSYLTT